MSVRLTVVGLIASILYAKEVSINGIEPARIEMRVADHVNVDNIVSQLRTILNEPDYHECPPAGVGRYFVGAIASV